MLLVMYFEYFDQGDHNIVDKILRALPDWFGIENSILAYVEKSKTMPMIVALEEDSPIGFLSLLNHSQYSSEIYVMGVLTSHHRKGVGRGLVKEAEKILSTSNVEYLQVKTLSPDRENEAYKKTRLFYKSYGFKEVEIFPTLWDEANPCLMMIKNV